MNISNETKVGVFVVFALTTLILGYNYLKGKNLFVRSDTYYALYDNAASISESNPVLLQGYKVGRIDNIQAVQVGKTKIMITINLKKGLKVPIHSKARIVSTDITGTKAIQLLFGDSKTYLQPGDTLIGETEVSLSEAVDKIVSPIEQKLNSLMGRLQLLLDDDGISNLKASFANLKLVTQDLHNTLTLANSSLANNRLSNILSNIEEITKTLDNNKENLGQLLGNLKTFSDSLKAAPIADAIRNVNSVAGDIDKIATKINKGQGSLGLLINNDSLYVNLQNTSANLNKLVVDLKQNPRRYVNISVFGGKKKSK